MMWVLHILALLFFFPALFITIPLHIVIGIAKRAENKTSSNSYIDDLEDRIADLEDMRND